MIKNIEPSFFDERYENLQKEKEGLSKKYSQISTFRILSFLAGVALLCIGIFDHKDAATIAGVVLLVAFIALVKKHSNVVKETECVDSKLVVCGRYIKRFKDEWRSFEDTGKEYLLETDTVAKDLDLIGDNSLYQMLSVCHTKQGKREFANELRLTDEILGKLDKETIRRKKEAINELASDIEYSMNYEAAGIRIETKKKKNNIEKFKEFCQDSTTGIMPGWANAVRFIFPIIEITLIVLWLCGVFHYGYPLVGFLVFLAFTWITNGITSDAVVPFYSAGNVIDEYTDMLELISNREFSAELLKSLKENISGDNGAVNAFKALRKIIQAYNISFNPVVHQLFSGIFLWDYQIAGIVAKWKKKYGDCTANTFDVIAYMEVLLSYSVLGVVRSTGNADIKFGEENISVHGKNIYHPLISPDKVVANDVALSGGITIITGSNMSGKTTYLRTLAMNMALGYLGAMICGDSLECNFMKIFTSMRVTDDVANGISTFYAEILRIKAMADYRQKNLPMICLVDEIFKGTNSADRIYGAKEVITKLAGSNCITAVSTHDFELCSITDKNGNEAVNYHFEEYYEDDVLKFDYKKKDGRCTTTNARAILKMAGF